MKRKLTAFLMVIALLAGILPAGIAEGVCPGSPDGQHNWQLEDTTEPWCTEPGMNCYYCADCGAYKEEERTPALGHDYDTRSYREPMYNLDGYRYVVCRRCGHAETIVIPALGHDEQHDYVLTEEKPATCTEMGSKTFTCTVCGDTYSESTLALGHNYVLTEEKPATCTEGGSKTFTCTVCGDTYSESAPALGHDYDTRSYREPMYNLDGYRYVVCRRCGHAETIVIPALTHDEQHDYVLTEEKPATCTEMGSRTFTCTVCGDTYSESMLALGHDYDTLAYREPMYNLDGYRYVVCRRCGHAETIVIPALGHDEQHDYVLTEEKPATCTEMGSRTFTCTVCGDTYSESMLALGHAWNEGVITTNPGCDYEGVKTYTCTRCGATRTEAVPATGHLWDEGDIMKKAGFLEEGEIIYNCRRDPRHRWTQPIPVRELAGKHNLMSWLRNGGDVSVSSDIAADYFHYPLITELYQPAEVRTEISADLFRGYWKSAYVDVEGSACPASTLDDETDLYVEGTSAILGGPVFHDVQVKMDSAGDALTCSTDDATVLLQLQQDGFLRLTMSQENGGMIWYLMPVYVRGLDPEADAELDAFYREAKVKDFVTRCYQNALGREGSEDEIASWTAMVTEDGRAVEDIVLGILGSVEFQSRGLSNEEIVKALYRIHFNREADEGGLSYWTGLLDSGEPIETVEYGLAGSDEFKSIMSD